jgi:choline dehydrogenase-like flavoprotein
MRLELASIGDSDRYDYCIIGTGPAGILAALGLAGAGKRVVLLEGGSREATAESQDIYRGEIVGDPAVPLAVGRLRYFGGSSNHWSGWCRPLDAYDFTGSAVSPLSGWPIARSDLDPYLDRAFAIVGTVRPPPDRPLEDSGFIEAQFVFSDPPIRFAEKYEAEILRSPTLFLVLDANLETFSGNGSAITGALVRDYAGLTRTVRADRYVLACGGIENSRLLLWSNVVTNGQTVPNAATLGKFWMDHPHFTVGEALLLNELTIPFGPRVRFFSPTEQTMREEGILNCGLRVQRLGLAGARQLAAEIACIAPRFGEWVIRQLGKGAICGASLRAAWQPEPRAVNRIELGSERDAFGMPRPVLYWQKGPLDLHTVQASARRFASWLAERNAGRARLAPFILGETGYPDDDELMGNHHMGGTRMASGPDAGIVDADCKVFGRDNLYLAGSSVFPSGGHANPTLTIIQLTLRLVDHLLARA